MSKNLRDCKTGKDFKDHSVEHGARIEHGKKHDKIVTDRGCVPLPRHGNRDLGQGLRHKIVKELIALGISCFAIFYVLGLVI